MRDILIVVCVCVIKKFKLLRDSFFSKEKIQKRKISFFFVLSSSSCKKSLHHNSFIIRTSLSLSLSAIYTKTLNDKKKE